MAVPTNEVPSASASRQNHADWLEIEALRSDDGNSSYTDISRVLRRSGTTDSVDLPQIDDEATDGRGETSEVLADSAFDELHTRATACGDAYPFEVHDQHLQLRAGVGDTYLFLLLLSRFGVSAGPSGIRPERDFEDLSLVAAAGYFGGPSDRVGSFHFGFPRRLGPAGFKDAVDELCRQLGEGAGASNHPTTRTRKDAHLDLVVWHSFGDAMPGQVIGFGQCAAGKNWADKASELNPGGFHKTWFRSPLPIDPLRMFFVPHRVDADQWPTLSSANEAIIFDRCRIARHAPEIPSWNTPRIRRWIGAVGGERGDAE